MAMQAHSIASTPALRERIPVLTYAMPYEKPGCATTSTPRGCPVLIWAMLLRLAYEQSSTDIGYATTSSL
eukprot:2989646-Rhodomonas_salina.1